MEENTVQEVASVYAHEMANGLPRMSFSSLMKFLRSPLHMLYDKEQEDKEETDALRFGKAFHCMVLEPDKWEQRFVTIPEDMPDRPTATTMNARYMSTDFCVFPETAPKKPTKATLGAAYMSSSKPADIEKAEAVRKDQKWHDDFEKENAGKVVLTKAEHEKRKGVEEVLKKWDAFYAANEGKTFIRKIDRDLMDQMCLAIEADDDAVEIIMNNVALEQVLTFTDEETGIVMKVIVDIVGKVGNKMRVPELKTAADASPDKYGWEIITRKTYMQLAIQIDAIRANAEMFPGLTITDEDAHVIAIEKSGPFGISVHDIDPELIKRGRYEYQHALKDVKHWFDKGAPRWSYRFKSAGTRNMVECPASMKV